MGFGAPKAAPKPTMLVGLLTADTGTAKAAMDKGADVVVLDARQGPLPKDAPASLNGELTAGGWLGEVTPARVDELAEAGLDFVLFDAETTPAAALLKDKLGFVLVLPGNADEHFLRSLEGLNLDAIYLPSLPSPLTVARHLELLRTAMMARKPLACSVPADASKEELEGLRAAGVALLLVEGDLEGVARLRETVMSLPPRRRNRDERPAVSLPRSQPTVEHEHDEDDD